MQSSKQGMWKEYHWSVEGLLKRYLLRKMVYKRVKGLDLGAEPPRIKIHWVPPGLKDASSVKSCLHLPIISLISVWIVISGFVTGSKGDVFVARTSKPVENLWKNGLFWSRYSFDVTHSIYRKPRDWELARLALRASVALRETCRAPARIWLAVIDFQNGEQQSRSRSDKKRRNHLQ